jgi:hypothetical protein
VSFEEWWASYKPTSKKTFTVTIAHAAYDAGWKAALEWAKTLKLKEKG